MFAWFFLHTCHVFVSNSFHVVVLYFRIETRCFTRRVSQQWYAWWRGLYMERWSWLFGSMDSQHHGTQGEDVVVRWSDVSCACFLLGDAEGAPKKEGVAKLLRWTSFTSETYMGVLFSLIYLFFWLWCRFLLFLVWGSTSPYCPSALLGLVGISLVTGIPPPVPNFPTTTATSWIDTKFNNFY